MAEEKSKFTEEKWLNFTFTVDLNICIYQQRLPTRKTTI
jgi:hypothetical protein